MNQLFLLFPMQFIKTPIGPFRKFITGELDLLMDLRGISTYWLVDTEDDYKTFIAIAEEYDIDPPKCIISRFDVPLSAEAIETNYFSADQLNNYPTAIIYAMLDHKGHYDKTIHDPVYDDDDDEVYQNVSKFITIFKWLEMFWPTSPNTLFL